jgi:hypothetical protein
MKSILYVLWLAVFALLAACSSDASHDTNDARTSIAAAAAGELTVELFARNGLETGMTPLFIKVRDAASAPVTDATVTFEPLMHMADGKNHSAPVIGPPALDAEGYYQFAVVFQMASTQADTWSATVRVARPGAAEAQAAFPLLTVADSGRGKPFHYTAPDETRTKYVASLNFEQAPKVGLNPVIVTLHRMVDMMTFEPVDDAIMVLDPQMPSMGHGSPGSVDPTPTSQGRYQGKLSFSMPGPWETTITITVGGTQIGAPVFATVF